MILVVAEVVVIIILMTKPQTILILIEDGVHLVLKGDTDTPATKFVFCRQLRQHNCPYFPWHEFFRLEHAKDDVEDDLISFFFSFLMILCLISEKTLTGVNLSGDVINEK